MGLRRPQRGGILSVIGCGMAAAVDIWGERMEGEWEQKRRLNLYFVACGQVFVKLYKE